jgi:hypothetical protein
MAAGLSSCSLRYGHSDWRKASRNSFCYFWLSLCHWGKQVPLTTFTTVTLTPLWTGRKTGPTVTGRMQPANALVLGISLSLLGLLLLGVASPRAALFGFLGLFLYVVPYTMWSKRRNDL